MTSQPPKAILAGRYELLDVAGRGGMAVVWRGRMRVGRQVKMVAVKRMLFDVARDPETVAMFVEEARVGLQLRHPNIVQVIDFGADAAEGYFLVMEWVDGVDLLEYMRSFHGHHSHMPWPVVAAIGAQALQGLAAAHERIDPSGRKNPVIHRDMSPSNVMIGADGLVKIADFGLARAMDRASMTMPNIIKGKLSYTAPEVASGQKAHVRSDIFGFGVSLWECLTARKLFAGNNNMQVMRAICDWDVPRLDQIRPDVPRGMVDAVDKAIARDPAKRFESARAMSVALQSVLRTLPQELDRQLLGSSVEQARRRLAALDQSKGSAPAPSAQPLAGRKKSIPPPAGTPEGLSDALEVNVEFDVDVDSTPASVRGSSRWTLSEPFADLLGDAAPRRTVHRSKPKPAAPMAPRNRR